MPISNEKGVISKVEYISAGMKSPLEIAQVQQQTVVRISKLMQKKTIE